jgi:hypothetical protein
MAKANTGPRAGMTEDGLRWEEVDYNGTTYRIREILVEESDAAWDASQNPGGQTFNARLQSRLELSSTLVSPATTPDDIAKWPRVKLTTLLRVFDRLNTLPPASAEGEDSAPAT